MKLNWFFQGTQSSFSLRQNDCYAMESYHLWKISAAGIEKIVSVLNKTFFKLFKNYE